MLGGPDSSRLNATMSQRMPDTDDFQSDMLMTNSTDMQAVTEGQLGEDGQPIEG